MRGATLPTLADAAACTSSCAAATAGLDIASPPSAGEGRTSGHARRQLLWSRTYMTGAPREVAASYQPTYAVWLRYRNASQGHLLATSSRAGNPAFGRFHAIFTLSWSYCGEPMRHAEGIASHT